MSEKTYARKTYTSYIMGWRGKSPFRQLYKKDKIIATAEITQLGDNQAPYFAITGNIYANNGCNNPHTCGCIHKEITKYFPRLAKYIKWHLMSTDGPLHYIENSLFWAGFRGKYDDVPNYDYLKSICVYGAIPEDEQTDITTLSELELTSWLVDRHDKLIQAWKADMIELFGEEIFSDDK